MGCAVAPGGGVVVEGTQGYVKSRPGTAEEAAIKRSMRKDAPGLITKVETSRRGSE